MNNEFASSSLTMDQMNAIVKKLGGYDAALKCLRGELKVYAPTITWQEKDSFVTLSLTSDGTSGEGWISRLKSKGVQVDPRTENALLSERFIPTSGVTTEVVILKGKLFADRDRVTQNIHTEARSKSNLATPNVEIACLVCVTLTNLDIETMGLCKVVIMHDPFVDGFLCVDCNNNDQSLVPFGGLPDFRWGYRDGFAFVRPASQ